ncbi:MAG TPA: ATP-binding protein, partial [Kofleriaceae bacterium]
MRAEVARLQAELSSSRALYQATIESLPFDFWARDREGYCVSQNRATREHWGDLLARRPEDMDLPADVIENWLANNRRALAGEIVRGEVDYTLGGELRHIQNVLAPIRQGDAIVGTLGVNIDLTDLRRAEADRRRLEHRLLETQRLETLGLLAGGVAHDINNIVMIVLGLASLARRHADPGSALDRDLATIENASRRAGEICGQLLAFAGRGQLELEPVDLSALVGETLELVRPRVSTAIQIELAAPASLVVVGDPTQLRQLVMNLILNAGDAIGDSAGRIGIRVAPAERAMIEALAADPAIAIRADRSYALLEISDTGRGMSVEIRARIFEPFFTTKASGRGLGLAAALGTVRGHQGALTVESVERVGSTFRVF